jgi:hypothetical protein
MTPAPPAAPCAKPLITPSRGSKAIQVLLLRGRSEEPDRSSPYPPFRVAGAPPAQSRRRRRPCRKHLRSRLNSTFRPRPAFLDDLPVDLELAASHVRSGAGWHRRPGNPPYAVPGQGSDSAWTVDQTACDCGHPQPVRMERGGHAPMATARASARSAARRCSFACAGMGFSASCHHVE